jgi:hypothetical protein
MNTRSIILSLATLTTLALATVGCEPARPAITEVQSMGAPVQLPAGLADGSSRRLAGGAATAYWVGQKKSGEWYLRTTAKGERHRYQGRIRPAQGAHLSAIEPTRVEHSDRMRLSGSDIVFDFTTAGDVDGFDFRVSGNSCVEFDLRIDGAPMADAILLGAREQRPVNAHFYACP